MTLKPVAIALLPHIIHMSLIEYTNIINVNSDSNKLWNYFVWFWLINANANANMLGQGQKVRESKKM